jgi:hypothetical protein
MCRQHGETTANSQPLSPWNSQVDIDFHCKSWTKILNQAIASEWKLKLESGSPSDSHSL